MSVSPQRPITYSMIFGHPGEAPEMYLSTLNRSVLIQSALFLLHMEEEWKSNIAFFENFFGNDNEQYAQELWTKIQKLSDNQSPIETVLKTQYRILSKHSCLELLRISFSLPNKIDVTTDSVDLQKSIFQALLSINETLNEPNFSHVNKLPEHISSAYSILMNTLPYNEFTNTDTLSKFLASCKKSELFFEFCERSHKYRTILQQFIKSYGCSSWEKYLYSLIKIFILNGGNKDEYSKISLDIRDNDYEQELFILTRLSIDINDLISKEDNIDYRVFRNNPLVRISPNEFMVIYSSLCVEKLYNSLIFQFNEINESLPKPERISNLFQSYTSTFSEEYLFYTIIQTIISRQKYIALSGNECRATDNIGEPDYYIRNWNDIFLFEFKDVMMNASIKTSCDYEKLKSLIEDKLVCKKDSNKDSAIGQLTNNVTKILSSTFSWDKQINAKKVRIYPVLVVGDTKFTTPGMCSILNDYFINSLANKGVNREQVKGLIVVDINTLILYQHEFANKTITLKEVFDGYYNYLRKKRPYPSKPENIINNAFHHVFSTSTYIEENYKIKANQSLLSGIITRFRSQGFR